MLTLLLGTIERFARAFFWVRLLELTMPYWSLYSPAMKCR
jgi:hypothetical protein